MGDYGRSFEKARYQVHNSEQCREFERIVEQLSGIVGYFVNSASCDCFTANPSSAPACIMDLIPDTEVSYKVNPDLESKIEIRAEKEGLKLYFDAPTGRRNKLTNEPELKKIGVKLFYEPQKK